MSTVNLQDPRYIAEWLRQRQKPIKVGDDVIPTMLPALNRVCGGFGGGKGIARRWHTIIAGNTGTGKTVGAMNLADRALSSDCSVGIVSMEMDAEELMARHLAIHTHTPIRQVMQGAVTDELREDLTRRAEMNREEVATGVYNTPACYVEDDVYAMGDIQDLLTDWAESCAVQMVIVDYMQLVEGAGSDQEARFLTTALSKWLRRYAKRYQIATVGVSQFNRETSKNYSESPTAQGLFGSSGLENDSSLVLLLDHSRFDEVPGKGARTWVLVGKNRNGTKPQIPIWVDYETLRWREADLDEEDGWPTH